LLNLQTKHTGRRLLNCTQGAASISPKQGGLGEREDQECPSSVRLRPEVSGSEQPSDEFKEEWKAIMGDNVA